MKITFVRTDCETKVSPTCTKVFDRKVQRGRPAKSCQNCRDFKVTIVANSVAVNRDRMCECGQTFTVSAGKGRKPSRCDTCREAAVVVSTAAKLKRICGCGAEFTVSAGRGRKASKCDKCKSEGIVYRNNDDGQIETVRKETLAAEMRERKEANGRATAERLFALMGPLLRKTDRQVIEH